MSNEKDIIVDAPSAKVRDLWIAALDEAVALSRSLVRGRHPTGSPSTKWESKPLLQGQRDGVNAAGKKEYGGTTSQEGRWKQHHQQQRQQQQQQTTQTWRKHNRQINSTALRGSSRANSILGGTAGSASERLAALKARRVDMAGRMQRLRLERQRGASEN